jgi:hypothetical protein
MTTSERARVAVVTGASQGLGRALSLELTRRGTRVVMVARGRAALERARCGGRGARGSGAGRAGLRRRRQARGPPDRGAGGGARGRRRPADPQRERAGPCPAAAPVRPRLRGPRARPRGQRRRSVPTVEGDRGRDGAAPARDDLVRLLRRCGERVPRLGGVRSLQSGGRISSPACWRPSSTVTACGCSRSTRPTWTPRCNRRALPDTEPGGLARPRDRSRERSERCSTTRPAPRAARAAAPRTGVRS